MTLTQDDTITDRKLGKGVKSATEIKTLKDYYSKHAK